MNKPYPLTFVPMLFEKVWGGRRLAHLGKTLDSADAKYGESWEVADLAATSASGAGGQAVHSVIASGALQGRRISDAVKEWGSDLLGAAKSAQNGAFPLLIKFLDAHENLSVQTHPSAAFAKANPGAHLKTESWYILAAEPGAVIYNGIKHGVTKEQFAADLRAGRIVDDLIRVEAKAGACYTLPSGTCHALGSGVLVAEVQTPSDTTFRIHDWGRVGRELHVDQALACIDLGPAPGGTSLREGETSARLSETSFYTIDELRPDAADRVDVGAGCAILMVLGGVGTLRSRARAFDPMTLLVGQTIVIPAAIAAASEIEAGPELRVLRVGLV